MTFLVNGLPGSAAAERVRRITAELGGEDVRAVYRSTGRVRDAPRFLAATAGRTGVVYAMDMAALPVAAGALGSLSARLIVDTGDAPAAFFRTIGAGAVRIQAAELMERLCFRTADLVIVRGPHYERQLRGRGFERVSVIPDGVDLGLIGPVENTGLRRRLGLADHFTVGIQGYFTWFPSLGGGIGWELLHAMAARPSLDIHAVLIGDGPGLAELRRLAHQLGLVERVHLVGKVPYEQLARYLALCDVCLLPQTDDPGSWVRTTGKLPCYLAAGRYIIASRVGAAAELLPEEMLVDYVGRWDRSFPERLAQRLSEVMVDPHRRAKGMALRSLAERFDYGDVARAAAEAIRAVAFAASA